MLAFRALLVSTLMVAFVRAQTLGVCITEDQLAIALVMKPIAAACANVPSAACSSSCREMLAKNADFSPDQLACIKKIKTGAPLAGRVIPSELVDFIRRTPEIVAGKELRDVGDGLSSCCGAAA